MAVCRAVAWLKSLRAQASNPAAESPPARKAVLRELAVKGLCGMGCLWDYVLDTMC